VLLWSIRWRFSKPPCGRSWGWALQGPREAGMACTRGWWCPVSSSQPLSCPGWARGQALSCHSTICLGLQFLHPGSGCSTCTAGISFHSLLLPPARSRSRPKPWPRCGTGVLAERGVASGKHRGSWRDRSTRSRGRGQRRRPGPPLQSAAHCGLHLQFI